MSFMPCCKWLRMPTFLLILGLETIFLPSLCHKADHYIRCLETNECPLVFTVSSEPGLLWRRGGGWGWAWGWGWRWVKVGRGTGRRKQRVFSCKSSKKKNVWGKQEGDHFEASPCCVVVFTVTILTKCIYSLPGIELSTLDALTLSNLTTILWVVTIIIPF